MSKFGIFFAMTMASGCNRFKDPSEAGNFDPDHVLTVEISVATEQWDFLRGQTRTFFTEFVGNCMDGPFLGPYEYVSADVTIDDQQQSNVGIRKKGFIGSQSTTKPSIKINVDEYVEGAKLFGVDNITLNNGVQDPSLLRQCLSYQLFDLAGLPSPRCNFAHVYVNGSDLGIYVHVEPIKPAFLRQHFDEDDGILYEGVLSDFDSHRHRTFEQKGDTVNPSLDDIITFTEALEGSSENLKEVLESHLDLDAFFTFWAMESIVGHWDGYVGNRNNYYVYHSSQTDLFTFIPWGMDDGFDVGLMDDPEAEQAVFTTSTLAYYILEDAELSEMFYTRLGELLETVWNEDNLLAEIDRMETLLSSEMIISDIADPINNIRRFVQDRRQFFEDSPTASGTEPGPAYCIQEVGSINASFETTYGTLQSADPTAVGNVDIEMVWDDDPVYFDQIGCTLGRAEDNPQADVLVLFGRLGGLQPYYLYPYVTYDSTSAEAGRPLTIDSIQTGGAILYTDESLGYQPMQAAMIHSGQLEFEEYDTSFGSTVRGSLSTNIYNWMEVTQ